MTRQDTTRHDTTHSVSDYEIAEMGYTTK